LCFTFQGKGQTALDSLLSIWQDKTQSDSVRVRAFKIYIWDGFLFTNTDSAVSLSEELQDYSKERNYLSGIAESYNLRGIASSIKRDYPKALNYYQKAIKIDRKLGNAKSLAATQNNIGVIYFNQGDYTKALKYFENNIKTLEQANEEITTVAYVNIGRIYSNQGNYERALEYFEKELRIQEEQKDKRRVANTLNVIGSVYADKKDSDLAEDYYRKSLELYQELNETRSVGKVLNNLGGLKSDLGDLDSALKYFEQALLIAEEFGEQSTKATLLSNIGIIYKKKENYSNAISKCLKSFEIAKEYGSIVEEKDACNCLYQAYKGLGKTSKALFYYEIMNGHKDSLKAQEISQNLDRMEFQRKVITDSIQEAENDRLVENAHKEEVNRKNRTRNILIGAGLALLLVVGSLFNRNKLIQKSKKAIEKEKERSDVLLLNILPEEIANELKDKGRAKARRFENVSVLFTDFKQFTQTSEKLSPEELVEEIHQCFDAFDKICKKYRVEKIKTIGDAYMAAGGIPMPYENSAENTVRAAIEMSEFMVNRKLKNSKLDKPSFEMRVGVHTGNVVAGIVGSSKFQYDIWGDAVNTASRMESSGEVGKVNISVSTFNLVSASEGLKIENRGKISAKGKGELDMFFVHRS
jgi:adenylate cyclase